MDQKVVVAMDGSKHSNFALEWYFEHLHNTKSTLIVVHVADVHLESTFTFRPGLAISKEKWLASQTRREHRVEQIKQTIEKAVRQRSEQVYYAFRHLDGDPGPKICQFAKEEATLIATGARGHGAQLGSVSDFVLHRAHCPVAVCRERNHRDS